MKKHWQTGRYLILLNEFSQTPFVTMATGALVPRGVFDFIDINKNVLSEIKETYESNSKLEYVYTNFRCYWLCP